MAIETVGKIVQLTTEPKPDPKPIFNDAGPLERRLREMAERGELDLPTPHWHIYRDPLPGEPRPTRTKKVITAHRQREAAGRTILEFPSQVMRILHHTPPKRVVFDDQDTEEPNVLVIMRAGSQFKAQLKECRKPQCQLGLTEMV